MAQKYTPTLEQQWDAGISYWKMFPSTPLAEALAECRVHYPGCAVEFSQPGPCGGRGGGGLQAAGYTLVAVGRAIDQGTIYTIWARKEPAEPEAEPEA